MNRLALLTLALTLTLSLNTPLSYATGDAEAGKAAFAKCASCHQVGPSARGGFGPQLNGIIGRPAAATNDYKYSPAMKNSGIVWTEKNLTAFLKSPSDVVPGNKMRFWGISSDKQIADLLAYLRTYQ
jgi:cytochrome c